jgi:hypothetical protein
MNSGNECVFCDLQTLIKNNVWPLGEVNFTNSKIRKEKMVAFDHSSCYRNCYLFGLYDFSSFLIAASDFIRRK